MNSIDRLAQKFAELHRANRNPSSTAPRICSIVGVSPLRMTWGENIVITEDKIYLPRIYGTGIPIPNRYQVNGGGMVEETLTLKLILQIGDQVIAAPDETLQNWYLIDLI